MKSKEEFELARMINHLQGHTDAETKQIETCFYLFCRALNIKPQEGKLFFWIAEHSADNYNMKDLNAVAKTDTESLPVKNMLYVLHTHELIERIELSKNTCTYIVPEKLMRKVGTEYNLFRADIEHRSQQYQCAESDLMIIDKLSDRTITWAEHEYSNNYFSLELSLQPAGKIATFVMNNDFFSLPDSAQSLFWKLCRNYLLYFSSGYKGDADPRDMDCLIKRGWVETFTEAEGEAILEKKDNYCLTVKVASQLFGGSLFQYCYSAVSTLGNVVMNIDIEPKHLFFNEGDMAGIQRLEKMSREEEYHRITKELTGHNLRSSLSAILYGPSGTGKTEIVRQIALHTGRDLLMVDSAKLYGSFWGEDERNVRELFRMYRHLEALSQRVPILFIDECDGILGKRVADAKTRGDRSNNVVQNIFLEELNRFKGLLFATTNNINNLDPAMDRRFLIKKEFHAPDEQTRIRIWQARLPNLSQENIASLASSFDLTGAQIENVATQVLIDSILDKVIINYPLVRRYCEQETKAKPQEMALGVVSPLLKS